MKNWYEALPNFWLPITWGYDPVRWPDYTADSYVRVLEEGGLEIENLISLRGAGQPEKKQWGAWLGAFKDDKLIARQTPFYEPIADRMYNTARFKYLIPAWRRAITDVIGELDDVEDQISTILWVLEWISKKVVPLPPTIMNRAQQLNRTLDCAEKVLAGVTPFRSGKSDHAECLRRAAAAKRAAQNNKAGLLAWFKENWGRLLEAAQASNTWFDVGIVLGPIMGWIEEGMWGVARNTVNNYLIAIDAYFPGYREDFNRNAQELSDSIDKAWDDTWGSVTGDDWAGVEDEPWTQN